MTSSTIATKDFEPTNNPSEVLKPTENFGQQQTPVDQNLASTAVNSSEASLEKGRDEVDTSQKYDNKAGESIKHSSTSSGLIDTNTSPVSTEKNKLDEGGEKEPEDDYEDDSEDDSEDDFPKFEGGESRGRVVNPYAGKPPVKPRPK